MATLRIDIEQSGGQSVQRQINNLRETTNELNRTILQNREAALGADRAEQRHLRTLNQSNAVQKAQIQQRIQELNLQKQNIALAEREARAREQQSRGAGVLTRSLGGLRGAVGALGFGLAAREVGQFVSASARAAIQVESYTNAFASLGLGAQGAAQRIEQLQELSRLPGVSFDQAVAGAVRLRTVGIEGERADAVLREMGNALALVGSTDLSGALLGLTQIASRGRVSAEEINQLTERSGIFAAALQDAFGSISSENIQMQLDQAGESVQDFVDRFVGALQGQARVSLDSTANAIQNLQNSVFLLQAEIGERLTPVIASSARGLGDFLDRVRDFISGADDGTAAVNSFRSALQDADTALERRDAIDARIDYLETFKQRLFDAANELDRFDSRLSGIQSEIDETNERIQTLTDIREGRITTADLERDLQGLIDLYSDLAAEEALNEERALLAHSARSAVAMARLVQIREEKDELADQIEEYQNYIKVSQEGGEAAEQAHARAAEGAETATTSTKDLAVEVRILTEIYNDLATNVQEANEQFDLVEQSGFADFYRLVRGEIEAYGGAIDTVIPSVTDAEREQQAFNAAVQSGIDATNEIVGDPLADYIDGLGLTSEAADSATSGITDTSEATKELTADIDNANERLRDFDIALDRPTVTIPRLASAMQAFAGTAPEVDKVDEAVKQTTRSVDELLDNIRAEGTGISAFESFVLSAEASFEGLADETVPRVTRDIVDAFVSIAEGDEITDAFGRLGERAGFTIIDELSAVLSEQLSDAVIGQLEGVSISGIGGQLTGAAAALAAPVGIFAASVAAFALVGETLVRAFPGETQQQPITAADVIRAGGRVGAEELGLGITLPQLEQLDFGGLGLLQALGIDPAGGTTAVTRQRPGLGWRYNATLGVWEPRPEIYDETTGSGEGAPIVTEVHEPSAPTTEIVSDGVDDQTAIITQGVEDRIEQEQRYLEAVTELSERATEARLIADQRLADTQQDIYNSVAQAYEDAENRKTDITERAAEQRADADERLADTQQDIYNSVADFYEMTEERKAEISERAAEQRATAEQVYVDTVQGIYNDVADAFETAEEQKTDIAERAAEQRADADERLADTQQDIYNDVADAYEMTEERKTEVSERAAEDRADAEQVYVDTVQGIYNDVADAYEDAENRKVDIAERAAEQRADADERLADTQQDIYNDVADAYEDAEARKVDIAERAAEQRADADERLADTQQDIYRSVVDAFETAEERRADISGRATEGRADADMRYADTVQDIYNNLYETVLSIQERFNDRRVDLQEQQLETEQDRLARIEDLQVGHQDALSDIERDGLRRREDLQRELTRDIRDNFRDTQQEIAELLRDEGFGGTEIQRFLEGFESNITGQLGEDTLSQLRELQRESLNRDILLRRDRERDLEDISVREARQREDAQRRLDESLVDVNERAVEAQEELTTALQDLPTELATALTEAETAAGTTFTEAQANFIPAADAMTTALTTLDETLGAIDTGEAEALAGVDENFDAFVQAAGVDLPTALANAEPPLTRMAAALESHTDALNTINTGEAEGIAGVNETFAEVLETAGVPLTDALNNAQEPMTRFAVAGETLATSLDRIDTGEASALADLDMGLTDFIERAGVPLTDALNKAVEPMDRWTQALETHAETIAGIDADETEALGGVQTFLNNFIERAGVPLTDALNNAVAPMDRWTAALETHATAIEGINASELEGIEDAQARNPLAFTTAIQEALDPLLNQTTPTAMLESQTAMTNSETAMVAATTTARTAEITGVMETNTEQDTTNIENFSGRLTELQTGTERLIEAADEQLMSADHLGLAATALTESARLWAAVLGRQGTLDSIIAASPQPFIGGGQATAPAPQIVVNRNEITLNVDGSQMAETVDENLVRLDGNGRSLGSYQRSG